MILSRRWGHLARLALAAIFCLGGTFAGAAQREYHEAPKLGARVRAGTLEPVHERLPDDPVIVRPVDRVGTYGGVWRTLYSSIGDLQLTSRLGYETLVRWDRDGRTVIPGIAKSVDVSPDARTFTFHLRKGMKWSDGQPFTSDDFVFMRKYVLGNDTLTPAVPSIWTTDGKIYELTAPDPYTVVFHFSQPYGMFLDVVAYTGRQNFLFTPAHYSKRFHPAFRDAQKLNAEAKAAGYADWASYFDQMHDLNQTPQCPTLGPYVVRVPFPAQRVVAVRNPYYWKVDPAGNQLPYIDEIDFERVLDQTMLNLRAIDGQVDYQNRGMDAANFTLLMEASKSHHYHVQVDYATGSTGVYINQYSRNDVHRPILQDRRFRIALSEAINRPEAIEIIYNGLGIIDNGVTEPDDRYYLPGLDQTYVKYDPKYANKLLDELGLKRGAGGMRHWPDGSTFHEVLHIFPSEGGTNSDLWQLLADYWREVGLQFSVVIEDAALSRLEVSGGNSDFWAYRNVSQHWELDGTFKIPISQFCYHAPLYGLYFVTRGKHGIKPSPDQQRLVDWYTEMVSTPDAQRRLELGHSILKQWAREIYFIGICRPTEITVISDRFHNVPHEIQYNYRLMSPGYIGIEQFYIDASQPVTPKEKNEKPVPYLDKPQ
jgi:peptide/nickel transport system substrate-binding protein